MPRIINNANQDQLESVSRTSVILCFLTLNDPLRDEPARIVCEETGNISFANGQFINYWLDGNLFIGLPFRPDRLSDNDQVARAKLSIPAYDRRIGEWFRAMQDPGRMKIEYYSSDDWGMALDSNNARTPTGTPSQIYLADHLWVKEVSGGGTEISVDISGYDFSQEPLGYRATQELCPDLFRK
jgi:hypothetical protein